MKISQRDRKYVDTEHIYSRGCTGKSQQSKTEYLFFFLPMFGCSFKHSRQSKDQIKLSNYSMPGMASATSINLDSEQGTPCTSKTFSYQTACVWTVVLQPQILHMQTHQNGSKESSPVPVGGKLHWYGDGSRRTSYHTTSSAW